MAQETLVPNGASWRWSKGTSEASTPTTLWRTQTFNDSAWLTGLAPFHYGGNAIGGDDNLLTGTVLSDMRNNYGCIFLRRAFVITNVAEVASVQLTANYDDGFIAWINGIEVARANVSVNSPTYLSLASSSIEPSATTSITVALPPQNYLDSGSNVLAVQVFNGNLSSSDLRFEAALQFTRIEPPVITNVTPPINTTVGSLTQITVVFNKTVNGVNAADLLINGQPASSVTPSVATNVYTFTFTQPLPGEVSVRWDEIHDIADVQGAPFDATAPGATWNYLLTDTLAPTVSERTPVAGAQVSQLTQIEVGFSEPVVGVDAADLLVNGNPASNVSGSGAGPYVFQFPQPSAGLVQLSWTAVHGITDTADAPNAFAGGNWSVTLNPGVSPGDVIINEFVAGNLSGLMDEDGERQDWIEIYNRGSNTVNLLGWSLTDDSRVPGKWVFPDRNLAPGQFMLVFASEKDRRVSGPPLHTNFKLDLFGEYLALFNAEAPRVAVSEFAPEFPEQRNDHSYGRDNNGAWRYFANPTPDAVNGFSPIASIAAPPLFSVERGLFDQPFNVVLATPLPGALIRYTRDGSEPGLGNGITYSAPISVTNTTTLRAVVFRSDHLLSRTRTHSYIFLDQVLTQPNSPPGFPSNWGARSGFGFPGNLVPADYEMDLDPVRVDPLNPASAIDPVKLQRLKDGLRELPIVSISMNVQDMFGSTGIYHSANVMNKAYGDKPCSVEMILPDGSTAFAETCGIRIHGNASRQPEKNPKHGFKLKFKGEFGPGTLKYRLFPDSPVAEYDDLILRADFGVSWLHWSDQMGEWNGSLQRTRAVRFRDAWMKESARDLGVPASRNRFSHLFINGLYWGTYDFSEQPKGLFGAGLFGGTKDDYDVYEQGNATSGYVEGTPPGGSVATYNVYQKLLALPNATTSGTYEAFKQYLDLTGYIDYTLLHFFVGHRDWGAEKNWYAIRQRAGGSFSAEGKFKFVPWDGECVVLNAENTDNRIPDSGGGNGVESQTTAGNLHAKLKGSAQYRLDFADRIHKHLVAPDGALTAEANIARWLKWSNVLDKAIVAESARWGDYRRDVHPYLNGAYQLYMRENQWLTEHARVVETYFPNRRVSMLGWLRTAGLYPAIDAPEFREGSASGPLVGGGHVSAGLVLAMKNPGAGTIYYTTNGTDPRVYHLGTVSGAAQVYSGPLTLNAGTIVKARVFNGSIWSALNEATFIVGSPGLPLAITEIMYNPSGGNAYEFIEIQNVGTLPLHLGGFSFQGITFIIPADTVLAPGAVLLLANSASPAQFAARYPGVSVFGYYTGNLDNGGERIAILDAAGRTVMAVHYDDEAGWPTLADGGGYSLEVIDPRGDPNSPANWRASSTVNGTPGLPPVAPAPANVVLNEIAADNAGSVTHGGAFPDWIELRNRGTNAVNLLNWSLTDSGNARKFVFPNTTLPAGGYLVVWCDSATNAPGLHTGFALGKNGESVFLYDANTDRADAVSFGQQITDLTLGRVGENWTLTQPTPGAVNVATTLAASTNIVVNEWLADSSPGGSDWLELFNRSAGAPVALRGLHLSTGNALFQIRTHAFLAPRGFIQLFADELPGPNHLEFKLPAAGGAIALVDAMGVEHERVIYGPQVESLTEGRLPDGSATIATFPGTASPGASNYRTLTSVVINEVLTHTDAPLEDAIELHNPTGGPVDIGGWYLSDSQNDLKRYRIPDGTTIPPGGFKVFYQYQFGAADGEDDAPPLFSFNSAHGDSAYVSQADAGSNLTGYRAGLTFGAAANGVSFGRHQTSIGVDFVALSARTFGMDNPATLAQFRTGTGAPNAYPLVGPVVISEIMYHPPPEDGVLTNAEFIELHNVSSAPVPLYDPAHSTNVWRLANAVTFDFPPGTVIPADGHLLVVPFDPVSDANQLAAFQSVYGTNGTVRGPYVGRLDNSGEALELWRPDAPQAPPRLDAGFVPQILVERVSYSPVAPWPAGVSGTGASLQRIIATNYGNDPVNWRAAAPTTAKPNTIAPTGSAALPGGGVLRLTFTVQSGLGYQFEYKNALTDPQWLPLGDPIVAESDELVLDQDIIGQPQCFYRLSVQP